MSRNLWGGEAKRRKACIPCMRRTYKIERLSRVVLAIHSALPGVLPLREDLAADGLESFSVSRYYPNHVNIIAGSESEFIYELGLTVLRRKGRMTAAQRLKRTALESKGRADPKGIEKSMRHQALRVEKPRDPAGQVYPEIHLCVGA